MGTFIWWFVLGCHSDNDSDMFIYFKKLSGSCHDIGWLLYTFQLSGMLYKNDILHMQSWLRVPSAISALVGHSLGRMFHTACPTDLQAPMGATLELQRLQHVERLEQQMIWAQLARQASPPATQVFVIYLWLILHIFTMLSCHKFWIVYIWQLAPRIRISWECFCGA